MKEALRSRTQPELLQPSQLAGPRRCSGSVSPSSAYTPHHRLAVPRLSSLPMRWFPPKPATGSRQARYALSCQSGSSPAGWSPSSAMSGSVVTRAKDTKPPTAEAGRPAVACSPLRDLLRPFGCRDVRVADVAHVGDGHVARREAGGHGQVRDQALVAPRARGRRSPARAVHDRPAGTRTPSRPARCAARGRRRGAPGRGASPADTARRAPSPGTGRPTTPRGSPARPASRRAAARLATVTHAAVDPVVEAAQS